MSRQVSIASLVSRKRMTEEEVLASLTQAPSEQAEPSSDELRQVPSSGLGWSPFLFAHMKQSASLKQAPIRQLVKWRVDDSVTHILCNVLPLHVPDPSEIISSTSFVWIPARILLQPDFIRGLCEGLVFVQRRPVSTMQRGPPPCNFLLVLASARSQKPYYWVPDSSFFKSVHQTLRDQSVEKVGIPKVLFEVLSIMYPAYGTEYCSRFSQQGSSFEWIPDLHLTRRIELETLEKDKYAIPQEEAVQATIKTMDMFSTTLLNGYCGSGKTVMMIELICRYRKKTAVLVNKHDLAVQWADRFRAFAPRLVVKLVQSDQADMTDCDVAICQIKSLYSRQELCPWTLEGVEEETERIRDSLSKKGKIRKLKSSETYPWPWLASFGLVCVDEAHRIVASTALPCLALFPNAHILCATATPDRQDATHDALGPVFGVASAILQQPFVPVGVQIVTNESMPQVPVWKWKRKKYLGKEFVDPSTEHVDFEDVNYSRMVRELELDVGRNRLLLQAIWDAAIVKGRQTLVLGLIKSHLVSLAASLDLAIRKNGSSSVGDRIPCGLLFPETRPELVEPVKKAQVIFATFQFASEAFDVGTLSALVMVSPYKSRLVQVLGRILRRKRGSSKTELDGGRIGTDGWLQGGKWSQLPLIYLCDDSRNPWFHNTCVKQTQLIKRTYAASVERVEPRVAIEWPEDVEALKESFASRQGVTGLDVLFRDEDDDLFGDGAMDDVPEECVVTEVSDDVDEWWE